MDVRTFLPYSRTGAKPAIKEAPVNPQTIGEHMLKKRIDDGLLQKDVASIIGVSEGSITYWENGRSHPQVRHYPAIMAFLGYYPFANEKDIVVGRLMQVRYCKGFTYLQCAKELGVDCGTVRRWERKQSLVNPKTQLAISILWAQLPDFVKKQYLP